MPAATKRKPASKKKKPAEPKAAQDARKQMWVVVTFALGLLLGALIFIKGEKLWRSIHDCLFGVFGWSAWFLPPLVIYAAVVSALDKPFSKIRAKLWQILVLILLILFRFLRQRGIIGFLRAAGRIVSSGFDIGYFLFDRGRRPIKRLLGRAYRWRHSKQHNDGHNRGQYLPAPILFTSHNLLNASGTYPLSVR